MIKNIVFDLGNVILNGYASSILDKLDITDEQKEITRKEFLTIDDCIKLDLGEMTIKECFDKANFPFLVTDEYYEILVNYYKYREINKDVLELAHKLKKNGYKIYLLSNHCHEVYNYVTTDPLFEFLDGAIVSSEYHVVKPNKEIYEVLFNTYNLKPEECFFIDDRKENIKGGEVLGMKGHILNHELYGIEKLTEDLIKNGINID